MKEDHDDLMSTAFSGLVGTLANTLVTSNDIINSPNHYARGRFEVWDIIEHFKLNYNMGNVAKYILRGGVKTPDPLQDYQKAKAYLDREIAIRQGKTEFARIVNGG